MLVNFIYLKKSIVIRRSKWIERVSELSIGKLHIKIYQVLTNDLNRKIDSIIDEMLNWLSKVI